jgi:hypothetical protein
VTSFNADYQKKCGDYDGKRLDLIDLQKPKGMLIWITHIVGSKTRASCCSLGLRLGLGLGLAFQNTCLLLLMIQRVLGSSQHQRADGGHGGLSQ